MYNQKSRCPQNAAAALFSFSVQPGVSSGLAGGDEAHLVDLVGVAATGQVVDGSIQALQDGAVGSVAAQTLCDLVADVAGLDAGEDEGVGLTWRPCCPLHLTCATSREQRLRRTAARRQ